MKCELGKSELECGKYCGHCEHYVLGFTEKGVVNKFDRESDTYIICPWCGVKHSWADRDHPDVDGEMECEGGCEKKFYVEYEHLINIKTSADCNDNNDKHEWSEWKYFDHRPDGKEDVYGRKYECTKCDIEKYEFKVEKGVD